MKCMSHFLPAMWILSAFSTPRVVEACRWLAGCANLFLHLPFPSWHRPDGVYHSLSHSGLELCGFVVEVCLGHQGLSISLCGCAALCTNRMTRDQTGPDQCARDMGGNTYIQPQDLICSQVVNRPKSNCRPSTCLPKIPLIYCCQVILRWPNGR